MNMSAPCSKSTARRSCCSPRPTWWRSWAWSSAPLSRSSTPSWCSRLPRSRPATNSDLRWARDATRWLVGVGNITRECDDDDDDCLRRSTTKYTSAEDNLRNRCLFFFFFVVLLLQTDIISSRKLTGSLPGSSLELPTFFRTRYRPSDLGDSLWLLFRTRPSASLKPSPSSSCEVKKTLWNSNIVSVLTLTWNVSQKNSE